MATCSSCGCDECSCPATDTFLPGLDMLDPVNPHPSCGSICNGNTENNMFWRPGAEGYPGTCILDEMTYEQVWAVLRRHPWAKRDLLAITDDETLVAMANSVELVESEIEFNKKATDRLNANTTTRYYTLFRGNVDGTPGPGRSRR